MHKVIFTDIDGTLIDINTGQYGKKANELISIMKERNIPLILTSAKTRQEQNKIREDLDLSYPFIVENGGAIIIPKGYFRESALKRIGYPLKETEVIVKEQKKHIQHRVRRDFPAAEQIQTMHSRSKPNNHIIKSKITVIELGKSSREIRTRLSHIRRKHNINFKGVADIPIEELSKLLFISKEQAIDMAQRDYGETILEIRRRDIPRFVKYVEEAGMKVLHGGRFYDVTIGNDKGIAVGILKKLFNNKFHNNVTFFAIGDSINDVPMFMLIDIPILVQRPDGSWLNYDEIKVKNNINNSSISNHNIVRVKGIGPNGWENSVREIILELN